MIKKILISQPAPAPDAHNPYENFKSNLGVDVVFHPFITIEPISESQPPPQIQWPLIGYTIILISTE